MATKKRKKEETTFLLRNFSVELLEKLKDYTGEKTATKIVKICCGEYLELRATKRQQAEKIRELEDNLQDIKNALGKKYAAEKEILTFIKG